MTAATRWVRGRKRGACASLAVALIAGCFHPSYDHPACGPSNECPPGLVCNAQQICEATVMDKPLPDGQSTEPPDGCTTFSSQLDTCLLTLTDDITLDTGAYVYNTSTGELRLNGAVVQTRLRHMALSTKGGQVDAILVRNLRLSQSTTLHAQGVLPLAIIASDTITFEANAALDLDDGGAGTLASCSNPAKVGSADPGGGGGGGGGGYRSSGGNGSRGNAGQALGGVGASSIAVPAGPQGGCPGGKGGDGNQLGDGGTGGGGGGALYFAAGTKIELGNQAAVLANGGGGRGGKQGGASGDAGGGGGGSGGMIWIDAPHVIASQAVIAANGGGGGEGSSDNSPGNDGQLGRPSTTRASGGTGGADDGTDGGRGGSFENESGESGATSLSSGGGGGGGGTGYIVIVSPDAQLGVVSPAPTSPR